MSSDTDNLKRDGSFLIEKAVTIGDVVEIQDLKVDGACEYIEIPITNNNSVNIKFKKGDVIADIKLEVVSENLVETASVDINSSTSLFCERKDLNEQDRNVLPSIINDYFHVLDSTGPVPKVPYAHEINLRDDEPVASRARRLAYSQRAEVDKHIDNLRLDDLIEGVEGCNVFSVLDLRGLLSYSLRKGDKHETAFIVPDRKFQWVRMPFGLHGASFSLATAMSVNLSDYKKYSGAYYDDVIIFSNGKEEHVTHLRKVFGKLGEYGMSVNMKKCQFMKSSVSFLGHVISSEGIYPE